MEHVIIGDTIKGVLNSSAMPTHTHGHWKTDPDITAREIYQTAVKFGPEIKEVLIQRMYCAHFLGSSNTGARDAYASNLAFKQLVDQAFDEIITLLAVKRMTE